MSLASLTCLTRSSAKGHPSEQPARGRVSGGRPWPVVAPVAGGGKRRQRGGHGRNGRRENGRRPGTKDGSGGPLLPLLPLSSPVSGVADVPAMSGSPLPPRSIPEGLPPSRSVHSAPSRKVKRIGVLPLLCSNAHVKL